MKTSQHCVLACSRYSRKFLFSGSTLAASALVACVVFDKLLLRLNCTAYDAFHSPESNHIINQILFLIVVFIEYLFYRLYGFYWEISIFRNGMGFQMFFRIGNRGCLDMFYRSETCRRFHDEETGLYLQGNLYVLNDFLAEISA